MNDRSGGLACASRVRVSGQGRCMHYQEYFSRSCPRVGLHIQLSQAKRYTSASCIYGKGVCPQSARSVVSVEIRAVPSSLPPPRDPTPSRTCLQTALLLQRLIIEGAFETFSASCLCYRYALAACSICSLRRPERHRAS